MPTYHGYISIDAARSIFSVAPNGSTFTNVDAMLTACSALFPFAFGGRPKDGTRWRIASDCITMGNVLMANMLLSDGGIIFWARDNAVGPRSDTILTTWPDGVFCTIDGKQGAGHYVCDVQYGASQMFMEDAMAAAIMCHGRKKIWTSVWPMA